VLEVKIFNPVPAFESVTPTERAQIIFDFLNSSEWQEDKRDLQTLLAEEFSIVAAEERASIVRDLSRHKSRMGKKRQVWADALGFVINRILGVRWQSG
jgi:hypothetical protein